MNANRIRFYNLFAEICREPSASKLTKNMSALAGLDFAAAAEVWDYFATVNPDDPIYGEEVFRLFYSKSAKATVKLVKENPSIRKSVFGLSPSVAEGVLLSVVSDSLLSGKTEEADELIRCVFKNASVTFGAYMKALVEKLFVEILKKNNNSRIVINKKVTAPLLSHIARIKTDERALLEQRLKEIN